MMAWRNGVRLATLAFALALAAPAQAEKVLKVGVREMPATRANAYGGNGPPGIFTWAALFESVTDIDGKGNAAPMVARGWDSADGITWRFRIAPGQKFHNGEALTARALTDAVAFLASEKGAPLSVARNIKATGLTAAKAVDDLTVEFTLSKPNPIFASQIAVLPVFEPRHFADIGIDGFTTNPVGSGPFRFTAWTGNGMQGAAFAQYRTGAPKIAKIDILEIPEGATRVEALISRQIDVDVAVLADDFARIKASGANVHVSPAPRVIGISLISAGQAEGKGKATPFADKRVRQAVNHAVNRQAMVDSFLHGIGRPASQAATEGTFGYNPALRPVAFDPARAKALLAEAGFPNGFKMVVQATVTDPANKLMYEAAMEDLKRIGIDAQLLPVNFPTWLKHWQGGTWEGQGFGYGYFFAPEMDASRAFTAASCEKDPPVSVYYCDPEESKLLAEAQRELDPKKRFALLQNLLAVHQANAPNLSLIETQDVMGYGPRVRNFQNVNLKINYATVDLVE